jgi:shikimate dehydrogenase
MIPALSGATRIHVTIGDPIAQVKSPAGLTAGFVAREHNAIMIPMQVKSADVDEFFRLMKRVPNLDGIVITVPHKPAAFRHCDVTSERSRVLGVANVMRRERDGTWRGDMTDGGGFVDALKRNGFDPSGKRVLQVGAGGAGSALALALASAGVAELALCDLDAARRDAVLKRIAANGRSNAKPGVPDPSGYDLVVNATPAGMFPGDPSPVDASKLEARMFVADIITKPLLTPLLAAAQARGCRTQDGLALFEAQSEFLTDFLLHAKT